ncbi:MAG TPA: hypothetical protein PLB89_14880 [Flavobacteriales bacterium]|nr:hypothetical protein [Flavobacteriales bacterium]
MSSLDTIKSQLIDRIMVTRNEGLLAAIAKIFESTQADEKLELSAEQIELLMMSERDIEQGNVIAEDDMD